MEAAISLAGPLEEIIRDERLSTDAKRLLTKLEEAASDARQIHEATFQTATSQDDVNLDAAGHALHIAPSTTLLAVPETIALAMAEASRRATNHELIHQFAVAELDAGLQRWRLATHIGFVEQQGGCLDTAASNAAADYRASRPAAAGADRAGSEAMKSPVAMVLGAVAAVIWIPLVVIWLLAPSPPPVDTRAKYAALAPNLASVFGNDEDENHCIVAAANRLRGAHPNNYAEQARNLCRTADHLTR